MNWKFDRKIYQAILIFVFSSAISCSAAIQGNVLTSDALGNKVLVWNESTDGVMASVYLIASNVWTSPVSLSASSFLPLFSDTPNVSMNSVGDVAVAWEGTDPSNGVAAVCVAFGVLGLGWSDVSVVSDSSLEYAGNIDQRVLIEDSREVYVTWTADIAGETLMRGAEGVLSSLSTQTWSSPYTVSN